MNLTMIFLVLSVAICYMLYDTFKKPRNASSNQQNQPNSARIKTNYAAECRILKDLHEQKTMSARTRTLSIHLDPQSTAQQQVEPKPEQVQYIRQNILTLKQTTKIYVLCNKNVLKQTWAVQLLKSLLPASQFLPYNSIEGSVAILRQLNCNIHLESSDKLFKIIKQYLSNIWFVGTDEEGITKLCFSNEVQMLCSLKKVIDATQLKGKEIQELGE